MESQLIGLTSTQLCLWVQETLEGKEVNKTFCWLTCIAKALWGQWQQICSGPLLSETRPGPCLSEHKLHWPPPLLWHLTKLRSGGRVRSGWRFLCEQEGMLVTAEIMEFTASFLQKVPLWKSTTVIIIITISINIIIIIKRMGLPLILSHMPPLAAKSLHRKEKMCMIYQSEKHG